MLVFDSARLRALRLERQWSIEAAAQQFRLSYPMTRKLENGEVRPSITTLGRIVVALGVQMDSLFCQGSEETSLLATDLGAGTDTWIARTLATAPPLSDEQARRISAVLFARPRATSTQAG